MYEVPLIVNAYGLGNAIGILGISLTFAGVKPNAAVTAPLVTAIYAWFELFKTKGKLTPEAVAPIFIPPASVDVAI